MATTAIFHIEMRYCNSVNPMTKEKFPMIKAELEASSNAPTIKDIQQAQEALRNSVSMTPMLHSRTFSAMTGANIHLKAENLQRSGSFKVRGAMYKISWLRKEERLRGVITASAGNH